MPKRRSPVGYADGKEVRGIKGKDIGDDGFTGVDGDFSFLFFHCSSYLRTANRVFRIISNFRVDSERRSQ